MTYFKNSDYPEPLWKEGVIRAFISHVAKDKKYAKALKDRLAGFGIASFIAHEDIEPTTDWQTEIKCRLRSMDLLIALLTEGFRESEWTDQEVGAAIGREALVISVACGVAPHGFMGKDQAIQWGGTRIGFREVADKILEILLEKDGFEELAKDAFIKAVANAYSFDRANYLARFLPKIDTLTSAQEDALVEAFNANDQVYCAFHFYPRIVDDLKRMTDNDYWLVEDGLTRRLERLPF